jgi:hypothetical protein
MVLPFAKKKIKDGATCQRYKKKKKKKGKMICGVYQLLGVCRLTDYRLPT